MPDQSVFLQVINLDRSPDRLARMRADLGQHNVAFARLAAVDGKDSAPESLGDYDPERSRRLFGRELLTGEVGCYQSHLNAARKFLDSPDNLGLVLEDDVISPDDLAGMIRHLARLAGNLAKWDVMHLGRAATKFRTELIGSGWPIAMPTPFRAYYLPVTTHALLWSRPGAERFLSACSQIVMPVDSALNAHICRFGGGVGFASALVAPLDQHSLIDDGDPRARKGRRSKLSRFHVLATRRRLVNYWLAAQRQWHAKT